MTKWTNLPMAVSLALASTTVVEARSLPYRCERALFDVYKPSASRRAIRAVASMEAGEITRSWRAAGVPVSAIAEMACVERKTVYSWMENVPAREQNLRRLQDLREALGSRPEDLRAIFRIWDRKLAGGKSLRELLRAPTISRQTIMRAIQELDPAIQKHIRLHRRSTTGGSPVTSELPEVDITRS